jgi:hypothetical protein
MFGKDLLIKKYPFISFSQNIIEYFDIIGYQESMVPQILDSYRKRENQIPPTILSTIVSKSDYLKIDNDFRINQIYPENPYPLLINKNDINQEPPPTSNIIYNFCYSSQKGEKNIIYSVFAFKFYEKYRYYITSKDFEEYYIPKAFCIISQYSFFTLFNYICKNLFIIMTRKLFESLPFELIIYNIVNFIPSPINYGIHLNLFSNFLKVPDYEINQLSGYFYLDFDLSQIFNLLPLNLVIEIFFLTFIEKKIVFFSTNLEILNMVMFIMYALNYPCNDGRYFFFIASIHPKKLKDDKNILFSAVADYMLGINDSYREDIDTSEIGKFHYYVDIDNKKIDLKEHIDQYKKEDVSDADNLIELKTFIENILKDKDKISEKSFLKPLILRLKFYLEPLLKNNPDFSSTPKNKYVNFFNTSKEIQIINKKIQELFYDFCLNILSLFYHDFSLSSSFDNICKNEQEEVKKNLYHMIGSNYVEQIQYIKEESLFFSYFRDLRKYQIYFVNFIQNKKSFDLYKTALLYSDEFINIKIMNLDNKIWNKLSLFNIMDSLYFSNQQIISITLNNIFADYLDNLKKYFKHFYSQERINSNKTQLVVLNKKIINKYIYLLKNHYKNNELNEIFPYLKLKGESLITLIDRREIFNSIQTAFSQKGFIEASNYLIYSLVYIFSISITLHSNISLNSYLERLIKIISKLKLKLFTRQIVYILIKTFYKYYLIHTEKYLYPDLGVSSIKMYYFMLIDFILKKDNIIPDEEMLKIFNNFFSKIIYQERDSLNKKKNIEDFEVKGLELDEGNNFRIEIGKNFICFMKHCFTGKKAFKSSIMVKAAMKECTNSNIIIKTEKKILQPTINIKINEYIYSSPLFSPMKIYKLIQTTFDDFFDKAELDMSKLMIKNVRDVIANLILYGLELNSNEEILTIDFLVYTLFAFKDHEKNYGNNDAQNQKN